MSPALRIGRFVGSAAKIIIAVHVLHEHVIEIRPCTGASMYPTLGLSGNYILHSPLALRLSSLRRGDLVTAVSPLDPSHHVLKRVIGLDGDTVCVDPTGERGGEMRDTWVHIPKGSVWLAGDNTSNSTDSRDYGPIPIGLSSNEVGGARHALRPLDLSSSAALLFSVAQANQQPDDFALNASPSSLTHPVRRAAHDFCGRAFALSWYRTLD